MSGLAKRWTRFLGVVVIAVALPACGSGFEDKKNSDSRTLHMLVNITPNLTKAFWDDLVVPFEKQTGVDVVIDQPTADGVAKTLPQRLAAGNEPDIVQSINVDKSIEPLVVDLTGESWVADTPLAETYRFGGKNYQVGVGVQIQSLIYYNKTAFTKAGITAPPATIDDLTAAMVKLKAAGYLPLQTGGDWITGQQLNWTSAPSVFQQAPTWYADIASGKLAPSQTYLPWLELYKSWIDKGYISKQAVALKYPDAEKSFLAGKAAMYPMGSWFVAADAKATKDFEVGVFAAPLQTGTPPAALAGGSAGQLMIFKSTKRLDDAKALVRYLATDNEAITKYLKVDSVLRTGFVVAATPLGKSVEQIYAGVPKLFAAPDGFGDNAVPKGFATEFNKNVQGLYVGDTPAAVAKRLDAWLKANQK
ncbi:MAG TPA: ABC transporter substrate-binding protein [Pilimelia sp.]|nr:ABC transporter substrate-binding protein [Pilimelia sp.]